jgi:hypothetical protein
MPSLPASLSRGRPDPDPLLHDTVETTEGCHEGCERQSGQPRPPQAGGHQVQRAEGLHAHGSRDHRPEWCTARGPADRHLRAHGPLPWARRPTTELSSSRRGARAQGRGGRTRSSTRRQTPQKLDHGEDDRDRAPRPEVTDQTITRTSPTGPFTYRMQWTGSRTSTGPTNGQVKRLAAGNIPRERG